MPTLEPFRAYRYDLGRIGALSHVVAPPYDVIDEPLRQRLLAASPYNIVRADFGRDLPGDDERHNRHVRAAGLLRDWVHEGILRQDSHRAFYVVHQEYEVEGQRLTRKGVLARVRLAPFGEGIYPHEQTLAAPKADRLALLKATQMNLSPVFGLVPDSDGAMQRWLDEAVGHAPPVEATDHLGTVARLWPITDGAAHARLTGLLGPQPVTIADGHHRYTTCLWYRDELKAAGIADDNPAHFTLMMIVGMTDPGLRVLPTHRLLTGLPTDIAATLPGRLGEAFQVEEAASLDDAWERCQLADAPALALGTVNGPWHVATLTDADAMATAAPNQSGAWRDLPVSVLHGLAVPKLGGEPQFRYVHTTGEVAAALADGSAHLAALVPAATVEQVATIAQGGEIMPAKSTYFYPKLLTGLALHSLKGQ